MLLRRRHKWRERASRADHWSAFAHGDARLVDIMVSFGANIILGGRDVLRQLPSGRAGVKQFIDEKNHHCGPSVAIASLGTLRRQALPGVDRDA